MYVKFPFILDFFLLDVNYSLFKNFNADLIVSCDYFCATHTTHICLLSFLETVFFFCLKFWLIAGTSICVTEGSVVNAFRMHVTSACGVFQLVCIQK